MAETTLKFGPEWLRALTQTNGVSAAPTTAGPAKYKLADYRYGREEMLALFEQSACMPEPLREFQHLAVENSQLPLALVTMTEDEQRIWSRSVNSDAVLRLTVGKGAASGAGPGRGTRGVSVDRGRGRGRGGTYQRGLNSEDGGDNQFGAFIRPRPFERSQSLSERDQRWDEKKPDRQFQGRPSFDGDTSTVFRKEGRPVDNWRSGHAEEDENWRSKVSAQQPTEKWKSWRNHKADDEDASAPDGSVKKDSNRHWIEDHGSLSSEQLPEWIEEQGDTEKVGIFDGKGGFLETKDSDEENWEEEVPVKPPEIPKPQRENKGASSKEVTPVSSKTDVTARPSSPAPAQSSPPKPPKLPTRSPPKAVPSHPDTQASLPPGNSLRQSCQDALKGSSPKEDSFAHLAKAAENLMAEWTAEEEKKFVSHSVAGDQSTPEQFYKWLYKDPQGDVQGPFTSAEMREWFDAGYFTMELMVKRVCDAAFSKLGALIKSWNAVPFAITHQPPPLKQPAGTDVSAPPNLGIPSLSAACLSTPSLSTPSLSTPGLGTPSLGAPSLGAPSLGAPSLGTSSLGASSLGAPSLGTPSLGPPTLGMPNMTHPGLAGLLPSTLSYSAHQQYMQEIYRATAMQQIMNHLKTNEAFATLPPVEQNRICLQYYMASHPLSRPAGFGEPAPLMNLLGSMGMPSIYGVPHSVPKDRITEGWPQTPTTSSATSSGESRPLSVWDTDPSIVAASIAEPPRTLTDSLWRTPVMSQNLIAEQAIAKEQEEHRLQELRKHEEARLEEERKRAIEEAKRLEEQRELEEKRRLEEAERARLEQERVEAERKRKEEEEIQRLEEEKRKREEEEERLRKQKEEEEQQKREEELLWQQRLEDERRAKAERKKREEEQRKAEEKRKQEEAKRAAEEKKKQEKAMEQAKAASENSTSLKSPSKLAVIDIDEFIALKQSKQPPKAELLKFEKPQQAHVWGSSSSQPASTLSLAEIQRLQEEKERAAMAEKMQQARKQQEALIAMQQQQQQQQQQQLKASLSWASKASSVPVKSLSEIQQEEAERADKLRRAQQQQKQQRHQEPSYHLPGAWGGTSNNLLKTFNNTFQYLEHAPTEEDTCPGFWDDVVKPSAAPAPASSNSAFPTLTGPSASSAGRSSGKGPHSKKEEEQVMKLFETCTKASTDELTKWCMSVLGGIQSYLDIPTVVAILKDVESPADLHEYVHSFFGSSLDTKDFVQQFLRRREGCHKGSSESAERYEVHRHTTVPNASRDEVSLSSDGFTAARSKKKKKNKMQKMDSSLLGFTVQADPSRVNVGEIDRGDGF
ncbi:GRB10-interacting GYF protein 2-like [Ornithodoros turicata]|uniref:GRB10-interacting GYF protein 2-like n=1 Tax=Ornithodoros turicata TaxID=34597 RepID=UPI003139761F